jgi:hypothetical protein
MLVAGKAGFSVTMVVITVACALVVVVLFTVLIVKTRKAKVSSRIWWLDFRLLRRN